MLKWALPLILLMSSASFAQTDTYNSSFTGSVQTRSFSATGGNYVVTNNDTSTTRFAWGSTEGWVIFYGSCEGTQYVTVKSFTSSTFDIVCNNGTIQTEISGSYVKHSPPECRYGICVYDLAGISSITATPEELHTLGVPGY